MKVILEFDTSNEDEISLHKTYIKAEEMVSALWDITQLLRGKVKHSPDSMSAETYKEVQNIQLNIHTILNKHGVDDIVNN